MRLATKTWGSGDRSALLIHGLSSNADGWWRVGPELANAGFTVAAPDLPGHGESPATDDQRLHVLAAHVAELGKGWDVILGHSLGGAVAITMASLDTSIAQRLILEDPALVVLDVALAVEWLAEDYEGEPTVEEVASQNPTWHLEDVRIKTEALRQRDPAAAEQVLLQNDPWNLVPDVTRLAMPTLILGAETDPLVPPELGVGLADMTPNVTFETVPDSSHSMHRDEFDAFMKHVAVFVG